MTFIVCSLKNSCLFSMLLHVDIAGIDKPDEILSLIYDVDAFSGLF